MHPAFSIIVFTTLSGLGYGLAAVLGLGLLDPAANATKVAHLLALALIATGLMASTLHLGNPQRTWRALSQWRSSWLSREGVLALLTFLPMLCIAWASLFEGRYILLPGLLAALLAAATVYSTSMIYASLKAIDAWHTPLTFACYLLFAASGGLLAATLLAYIAGDGRSAYLALAAMVATAIAWAAKLAWRRRLKTGPQRSTAETATGLGHIGSVRLFERPHMTENYLTSEMGYKVARKHADKLFAIAFLLGGVLPVLLMPAAIWFSETSPLLATLSAALAVASHVAGMLVERWLFFAEARHAVMSYYGS